LDTSRVKDIGFIAFLLVIACMHYGSALSSYIGTFTGLVNVAFIALCVTEATSEVL